MPCSAADAPTATEAFQKATAGDTAGGMAMLATLDGGMGGKCARCLMANVGMPERALPACVDGDGSGGGGGGGSGAGGGGSGLAGANACVQHATVLLACCTHIPLSKMQAGLVLVHVCIHT